MVEVVSGALRALFMLGEGAFYVLTAAPNHRQGLFGRFVRENLFSLKSAEYADSRFGHVMKWFMWLMLIDTDLLMEIQYGINLWSDKELSVWRENILASFATVGIAGGVLGTVNIGAFALDGISDINWTARAFFAISLMTSVLSVIFGMRLQRRLYQLGDLLRFRKWLSDGEVYGSREREQGDESNLNTAEATSYPLQSSIHAVRVLQLPVELLTLSAITFVVGLILYTALMWKQNSDPGSLDYRNIMICLLLVLVALVSYYERNTGMKSIEDKAMHLLFLEKKDKQKEGEACQVPVIVSLRRRIKAWPIPLDNDDAVLDEEKALQERLRALYQSRRPWIYHDNDLERDRRIKELERISRAQEMLTARIDEVMNKVVRIIQQLPLQGHPETETRHTQEPSEADPASELIRLAKARDEKSVLYLIDDESTSIDVNTIGDGGRTALMEAAAAGDMGFVNALLHRHADPLIKDRKGKTAEDLARDNDHLNIVNRLAQGDQHGNNDPQS